MLARVGSRELVDWFAFMELEAEALERAREDAEADGADTGPQTLGDPDDPLGLGRPAPGMTMGG